MGDSINTKLWWFFETWKIFWSALSKNNIANSREKDRTVEKEIISLREVDVLE